MGQWEEDGQLAGTEMVCGVFEDEASETTVGTMGRRE